MDELTHLNEKGEAHMVDVSPKAETLREATATGRVTMKPETLELIKKQALKKGDVLSVARIAGMMAAKKTPELIPLCHAIMLDQVNLEFVFSGERTIDIEARVKCIGRTGVEMEAMTAVSVAALAIYDMCKAVDRGVVISDICLQKKSGGKSGTFIRSEDDHKATVGAVCVSPDKGTKKKDVGRAILVKDYGIENDGHASSNTHRQVSLLSLSSIEKMKELGLEVSSGDFAENITVSGMNVSDLPIGTHLKIGDEAVVEITQIGKECHNRCAIFRQVGTCIMPVEGVFARVIEGGEISTGSPITLV